MSSSTSCFFGAALFYWWPVLSPSREFPPITYPGQMLYQLVIVIGMTPAFAYITFSDRVLYAVYEYAPRLISGFSPQEDQLLAGSMMKIIGMAVALASFGWSFYRWQAADKRSRTSSFAKATEGQVQRPALNDKYLDKKLRPQADNCLISRVRRLNAAALKMSSPTSAAALFHLFGV